MLKFSGQECVNLSTDSSIHISGISSAILGPCLLDSPSANSTSLVEALAMLGEFALSSRVMQAPSNHVDIDRTSTLVGGARTPMTVDSDYEGFIILPNSASKIDATHVDEDSADLYTVVCASGTNLFLFNIY